VASSSLHQILVELLSLLEAEEYPPPRHCSCLQDADFLDFDRTTLREVVLEDDQVDSITSSRG